MEKQESVLLNQQKFDLKGEYSLTFTHKKVPLNLRTSFGTSHSSTKIRFNSFIQIILEDIKNKKSTYGLGESGLPPKKPGCYLADTTDIKNYIEEYLKKLNETISQIDSKKEEMNAYLKKLLTELPGVKEEEMPLPVLCLFYSLDNCPANKEVYAKASINCIEGAILDLLGKILSKNVRDLFNIKYDSEKEILYTFYTIGISDDDEMKQSFEFGVDFSRHIKIKLNHDLIKSEHSLNFIENECQKYEKEKGGKIVWSIDLNSDFEDPEQCIEFTNKLLLKYKERIYMIEQPFPVSFEEKIKPKLEGWKKFKELSEANNMLVYADESVTTVNSVEPIKDIISGINIKIEKCGGIRQAMKCAEKAKGFNLKIWIGTMVGSCLGMNMCATVVPLSSYSDMDGGLLLTEESQPAKNGFVWDKVRGCIVLSKENGLGVVLKNPEGIL